LLAIPIGNFLIKYLLHGVNQTISTLFVRVQVETLRLDGWEILLSFGVTVCISILAAYQPAREAMQVSPKEALEISQLGMRPRKSPRQLALGGLICILAVLPLSWFPAVLYIPLPGYLAILLLLVGFSLLAPWALQRISHRFSSLLLRRTGIPAYLASRYVRDSGTRTAVSVGALITAVALFVALVIMTTVVVLMIGLISTFVSFFFFRVWGFYEPVATGFKLVNGSLDSKSVIMVSLTDQEQNILKDEKIIRIRSNATYFKKLLFL